MYYLYSLVGRNSEAQRQMALRTSTQTRACQGSAWRRGSWRCPAAGGSQQGRYNSLRTPSRESETTITPLSLRERDREQRSIIFHRALLLLRADTEPPRPSSNQCAVSLRRLEETESTCLEYQHPCKQLYRRGPIFVGALLYISLQ
jgi:hypothetical protein